MSMGKMVKWSWGSALVGAASGVAATALISAKPKDPTFTLISINLTTFKLNLPVLDAELLLTVHVSNPNIVPIHYSSTTMSIFYEGSLLGSAQVEAGSQEPHSCQTLRLPARLNGLELAHHAGRFIADVARREMVLDAVVDIAGTAKVLWWDHKFKVRVESRVTVDPVFFEVIDQDNKSEMEVFPA
jgi:LEA14-like dessication related protein